MKGWAKCERCGKMMRIVEGEDDWIVDGGITLIHIKGQPNYCYACCMSIIEKELERRDENKKFDVKMGGYDEKLQFEGEKVQLKFPF